MTRALIVATLLAGTAGCSRVEPPLVYRGALPAIGYPDCFVESDASRYAPCYSLEEMEGLSEYHGEAFVIEGTGVTNR